MNPRYYSARARTDLPRTGTRVHLPSPVLYGTSSTPAYQPRLDSAQTLHARHAEYAAAIEADTLTPFDRAYYQRRLELGRPVSGDLVALVRAGAQPARDPDEAMEDTADAMEAEHLLLLAELLACALPVLAHGPTPQHAEATAQALYDLLHEHISPDEAAAMLADAGDTYTPATPAA